LTRNAQIDLNLPGPELVTRSNLNAVLKAAGPSSGSVDAGNPPSKVLEPFIAKWEQEYPAK
jgi:hypothetical protein